MNRLWEKLRTWGVWPTHEEEFERELARLSRQGLRWLGIAAIGAPLFLYLGQSLVLGGAAWRDPARLAVTGGILAVGGAVLAAARFGRLERRARAAAVAAAWVVALILMANSLGFFGPFPGGEHNVPSNLAVVMLVAVGTLPLIPVQTLALGFAIHASYLELFQWAERRGLEVQGVDLAHHVFLVMITLLSAALSGVIYRERLATWRAHQEALRVLRDLRNAQARALLSENAASLGRLAAALCHELNSPLGALTSAVDSLFLLSAKPAATDQERRRLDGLRDALRHTVSESTQRLHGIITRVLRLTELESSEVRPANLNDVLAEVRATLEPGDQERVELRLQPLPPLVCRPQQLTAAFANLLHSAVRAVNGSGRVVVSTRTLDGHIEVRVEDDGPALSPEDLARIFDPGFRVAGGRVGTGDWSLFGSRQAIQDHRGDIRVESCAQRGACVTVTLPC